MKIKKFFTEIYEKVTNYWSLLRLQTFPNSLIVCNLVLILRMSLIFLCNLFWKHWRTSSQQKKIYSFLFIFRTDLLSLQLINRNKKIFYFLNAYRFKSLFYISFFTNSTIEGHFYCLKIWFWLKIFNFVIVNDLNNNQFFILYFYTVMDELIQWKYKLSP
jgi:hypothetical protein